MWEENLVDFVVVSKHSTLLGSFGIFGLSGWSWNVIFLDGWSHDVFKIFAWDYFHYISRFWSKFLEDFISNSRYYSLNWESEESSKNYSFILPLYWILSSKIALDECWSQIDTTTYARYILSYSFDISNKWSAWFSIFSWQILMNVWLLFQGWCLIWWQWLCIFKSSEMVIVRVSVIDWHEPLMCNDTKLW